MIRLVRAELFKLRTTRMYLILLAAATGMVVLVTVMQFVLGDDSSVTIEGAATVIETEADLRSVLDVSGVAVLFTLILGATAISGEHRHRTIATTFLLTPIRSRVVSSKVVAHLLAGAAFGVVVEIAALVVAVGWLTISGAPIPFGPTIAVGLLLTPIATGLAAGFGVGISAAVPNQLGSVLVAVGWVMVAEQLVNGLFPGVAKWLPFTGAGAAITGQHPDVGSAAGIGLFVVYLTAMVIVGTQITKRRDIG